MATAFSNLVLLGIPFMLGVFGQEGFEVLSLLISVHLPTMMMASIILFELFGRRPARRSRPLLHAGRGFLRARCIANPLIVGILAGLAWRVTGLPLPGAGRCASSMRWPTSPGRWRCSPWGSASGGSAFRATCGRRLCCPLLKLILMPAVALAHGLAARPAAACRPRSRWPPPALPSGVNSYLIAVQFGTGQALASNQMTIATACAVVTTAFWLSVAQAVFG